MMKKKEKGIFQLYYNMCKMNFSRDSHKNSSNFLSSDKLFLL